MTRSRGSIVQKRGLWYAVVSVTDPATGKRRRDWGRGFKTRREANRRLTEVLARLDSGGYVAPDKQTVGAFLEHWLEGAHRLEPTTKRLYEVIVAAYITPRIGGLRLQRLAPAHLNTLYAELLAGGGRDGKPLSAKSVRNVHGVLRQALADAVSWDLLPKNPAARVKPPKAKPREMRTWSPEELRRFLEAAQGDRLHAAFVVAGMTGVRRGEWLGLKWSDIDLEAGTLQVRRSLVLVGSVPTLKDGTKTGRSRSVDLWAQTVAALRLHRTRQAEERLAWGGAYEDHGLVFSRENGEPLRPDRLVDAFKRIAKRAGLSPIRFHDLRHTHATHLLQAAVHPKIVSDRLGHATVAMTLETYSHVVPSLGRDAAEKAEDLVFG